jgi:hypothetical protein
MSRIQAALESNRLDNSSIEIICNLPEGASGLWFWKQRTWRVLRVVVVFGSKLLSRHTVASHGPGVIPAASVSKSTQKSGERLCQKSRSHFQFNFLRNSLVVILCGGVAELRVLPLGPRATSAAAAAAAAAAVAVAVAFAVAPCPCSRQIENYPLIRVMMSYPLQ